MSALGWETWVFAAWFLSYLWITRHIWFPKSPRLASTEQIFGTPFFDALFIDQSLMLNRRRDGLIEITSEDVDELEDDGVGKAPGVLHDNDPKEGVKPSDYVSNIYACATMWHESEEEQLGKTQIECCL